VPAGSRVAALDAVAQIRAAALAMQVPSSVVSIPMLTVSRPRRTHRPGRRRLDSGHRSCGRTADELIALAARRDQGFSTIAEFENQKSKFLA
jgi:hypothetical protein